MELRPLSKSVEPFLILFTVLEDQFQKARLRSLRIILVLSIIGSGVSLLNYMLMGALLPTMKTMYYSGSMHFPSEMAVYIEQVLDTPRSFYLCGALLYAMSLAGVILMWQLRKSGFHLYTLAQLLILLITVLFLGREMLSLGSVMFTILFVVYYYIALRNLEVFNSSSKSDEPADTNEEDK